MGGLDPTRELVLRALRAGQATSSPRTSSCSPATARSSGRPPREGGAELRFEAAVAGVVPVIRVLAESLAGAHVERIHGIVNGTTNFILTPDGRDRRLATPTRWPRRSASATPRPTRPRTSTARDAAAKMAILARLAFGSPVHARRRRLRGHRAPDRRRHGLRPRARPRPQAARARPSASAAGCRVRVHPAFLYAGHPLASVNGPFNAVTIESDAITEITLSRPGRRRPADGERGARRRRQRDDRRPPRPPRGRRAAADRRATSSRPSTCTSRSPTGPACSPRSPSASGSRASRSSPSSRRGWATTRGW